MPLVSPRAEHPFRFLLLLNLCLLLGCAPRLAASPERWAPQIAQWVQADTLNAEPRGAVLFVGSSSIRLWSTLARDFPGTKVINRGFGGSQLADTRHFLEPLVLRYQPRIVVLYAGDNDLAEKRTPEEIAADFEAIATQLHSTLPNCRLIYVAIKPSPSRQQLQPQMVRTNALIAQACTRDPQHRVFVDVFTPMLDQAGQPRAELFREDHLHMTAAGYALWTHLLTPLLAP
jgi:lysophospholipase L1-like esterase